MNISIFRSAVGRFAKFAIYRALALLILGVMASSVSAQDESKSAPAAGAAASGESYLEDAPNEKLKNNFAEVRKIAAKERFETPAAKQMLEDYLENYELKRWTQKKNFPALSAMRGDLRKLFRQSKPGQVHDRMNELVLDVLSKKIKNKKYHPAFLLNAMLAIGELNAVESGSPPTPLPQVLAVLLGALNDAQQIDAVKVAALVGIRRQVLAGVKDPAIATAALKLASNKDSDPVKIWMQKRAIEILGFLGVPGQGNQVVNLLQSIIADKKAEKELRWIAAESLGQIDLSKAAGLNADPLIDAMKQLMKDGCEAAKKKKTGDQVKRNVKCYMGPVLAGLGDGSKKFGVVTAPNVPAQKIADLQKPLKELLAALDNEEGTFEDIQKAVEEAIKKL